MNIDFAKEFCSKEDIELIKKGIITLEDTAEWQSYEDYVAEY